MTPNQPKCAICKDHDHDERECTFLRIAKKNMDRLYYEIEGWQELWVRKTGRRYEP
jgi:hypothetical protein